MPICTSVMMTKAIVLSSDQSMSAIFVSEDVMISLGCSQGNILLIKNGDRVDVGTMFICDTQDGCIKLNEMMKKNLRVNVGDKVEVSVIENVKSARRILVSPVNAIEGDLFEEFVKPYFVNAYRPVCKGNTFSYLDAEFVIKDIDPDTHCIVSPDTIIHIQ